VITHDAFLRDFDLFYAKLFDGVRHDSGDPFVFAEKTIRKFQDYGIDPAGKVAVFSDSLNLRKALLLTGLAPATTRGLNAFLRCGDLHAGFTRLHCEACGHDLLLAFSCKQRGLCATCHLRRTLTEAATIADQSHAIRRKKTGRQTLLFS